MAVVVDAALAVALIVTELFAGKIAKEIVKFLIEIFRKSFLCKPRAEELLSYIEVHNRIIKEIEKFGFELSPFGQSQLDRLSETLQQGFELANKIRATSRWNVYENLKLAKKMKKVEKEVSRLNTFLPAAHILAEAHHLRALTERRLEQRLRRVEEE